MRPLNLISLGDIISSGISDTFMQYCKINLRKDELDIISQLSLILRSFNLPISAFDNFYIGYTIPQISKEFDLLKICEECVINIELKEEASVEKIIRQLSRNKYYLSHLNKEIYLFTYVKNSNILYILRNEKLECTNISELVAVLSKGNSSFNGNIDDLFEPSSFLVSPFNSTEKFIQNKYFLTEQQEQIKKDILSDIHRITAIEGRAGTGKSLLLYDIAKQLMLKNINVLLIHVGKLNDGQILLNNNYKWHIISIRSVWDIIQTNFQNLNFYDIIIIDEVQRINKLQFEKIIEYIKSRQIGCILAFDPSQTLAWAEKNSQVIPLLMKQKTAYYKLTNKIRTNKGLANFIKGMFESVVNKPIAAQNINVVYFNQSEDALNHIMQKKDYTFINFTPSQYYNNGIIDKFQICSDGRTSHSVIGQEYDNVIVIIDSLFYYDGQGKLSSYPRSNNPYDQEKMLFQAITRVKKKLEIVVINNPNVFNRLMQILLEAQQYIH